LQAAVRHAGTKPSIAGLKLSGLGLRDIRVDADTIA
jgi:hypothetical protein